MCREKTRERDSREPEGGEERGWEVAEMVGKKARLIASVKPVNVGPIGRSVCSVTLFSSTHHVILINTFHICCHFIYPVTQRDTSIQQDFEMSQLCVDTHNRWNRPWDP